EAFAFDTRASDLSVIKIPFIPMLFEYAERYPGTFAEFLLSLAKTDAQYAQESAISINPSLVGKEIHEVMPIVFDGNPTDTENNAVLEPEVYAEYVVWWNRKYLEVSTQMQEQPGPHKQLEQQGQPAKRKWFHFRGTEKGK